MQEKWEQIEEKRRAEIQYIAREDCKFPEQLNCYERMPKGIYCIGALPDPARKSVAIIGARQCSEYGRAEAVRFGKVLSEHGVQIISGLASGVDAWAQRGALEGGTPTFSVVGTGVDICYPKANYPLYCRIIEQGGGILSEFEPGDKPHAWHFPIRNRIISALADIVIVVEAKLRSGSLITADYANEQGKDIFAVPGRNRDELSQGCNRLIAQGAGIAWNPEIILDALGIDVNLQLQAEELRVQRGGLSEGRSGRRKMPLPESGKMISTSDNYNKKKSDILKRMEADNVRQKERALPGKWKHANDFQVIYQKLTTEPQSIHVLQQRTGLSVSDLTGVLMQLYMSGFADEVSPGYFIKI